MGAYSSEVWAALVRYREPAFICVVTWDMSPGILGVESRPVTKFQMAGAQYGTPAYNQNRSVHVATGSLPLLVKVVGIAIHEQSLGHRIALHDGNILDPGTRKTTRQNRVNHRNR